MRLFFRKTEDEKYFIYRQKNRTLVYAFLIIGLITLLLTFYSFNIYPSEILGSISFIVFVLDILIPMIDFLPIHFKKLSAKGMGNEIIEKGNFFSGDLYEIKIEKKGLNF
jgi:hypothetical protein